MTLASAQAEGPAAAFLFCANNYYHFIEEAD